MRSNAPLGLTCLLVLACRSLPADPAPDGGSHGGVTDAEVPPAADAGASPDAGGPALPARSCGDEPMAFRRKVAVAASANDTPVRTANLRRVEGPAGDELFIAESTRGSVLQIELPCHDCTPTEIAGDLGVPVRVHPFDMDADGDRDLIVADIGSLFPSPELVGRVLILTNDGRDHFSPRSVFRDGRIACAEGADLDGDGDIDIAVCVFGDMVGRLVWLQQQPDGAFRTRELEVNAGAIHAFPFDADGDGDLDIAACFAQDTEAVRLFENDGHGEFTARTLVAGEHTYHGMSGIELTDLDQDGDMDILVTNGDHMDYMFAQDELNGAIPHYHHSDGQTLTLSLLQGVHGVAWLENDGAGGFTYHDIMRVFGAYAVRAADLDGDCDLDLALASYDPFGLTTGTDSVRWLENDGMQQFSERPVYDAPRALTLEVADWNGDGRPDVLTGPMVESPTGQADHRVEAYLATPGASAE